MQVDRPLFAGLKFGVTPLIAIVGPVVVGTSPLIRTHEGFLWALLAVSLTVAAAAVFVVGMRWWDELRDVVRVTAGQVAPIILGLAAAGLLLSWVPSALIADMSWRGPALVSAAIVGALTAAFVLFGIHTGLKSRRPATNAAALSEILRLRSLAQRQLGALGALVALATLALGASLRAAEDATGPSESIFVFGVACSAGVALVYLPARTALRHASERLVDAMFSLAEDKQPADLLETAEKRQALRKVLGLDGDLVADLHANIAILAPLLAGTVDLLI